MKMEQKIKGNSYSIEFIQAVAVANLFSSIEGRQERNKKNWKTFRLTVDRLRLENCNLYLKHRAGDLTLCVLRLTGWTYNKCGEEVELSRLSVSNDCVPLCSTLEHKKESIIKVSSVLVFPRSGCGGWWV